MADSKDAGGGASSSAKPDIGGMKLPTLWDDPTTEDEASKATKVVDASAALRHFREQSAVAAAKPHRKQDAEPTPAVGAAYVALLEEDIGPVSAGEATIELAEASLSAEELAAVEEEEEAAAASASEDD